MPFATVCVYAGSNAGVDPGHAAAARALGALLAGQGTALVYGGGRTGLMGEVADAALAAGGRVVGIIPRGLERREVAHRGLSELVVVGSMHERKAQMAERSDAFVALPGGLGTLEELVEAATWTQLGIHHKPIGLLDSGGYWTPLRAFLDAAVEAGFVLPANRSSILLDPDPGALLAQLESWRPATGREWLDVEES
ncbi:TIGR00730 family Rossman fold protein [Patulibacter sp.]|uniref:LOG family protein n=1 Tax=Patulibacter sp. TaxID=1912859 RepID=UPI002720D6EF|nr:TIGR00730 family Rossman fold protein [Patulibacter sp.]MDO9409611.1 TIGR00730 family Rossman fold protein [Patulibacter sp.]